MGTRWVEGERTADEEDSGEPCAVRVQPGRRHDAPGPADGNRPPHEDWRGGHVVPEANLGPDEANLGSNDAS